jgi:hypothetical protein
MLKASSTIILLILPVFLFSGTKEKLQSGTLPLVPRPVSVTVKPGSFQISEQTHLFVAGKDIDLQNVAILFAEYLRNAGGPFLQVRMLPGGDVTPNAVILAYARSEESLPTEGYHLEVRPDGIRLEGNSGAGLFYAMQTFLQLTTGDEMHTIHRLLAGGRLPVRVTHNDTKFNNILFDANNKAICIVDLDTVMPGTVLYDFGDAIRTGACTTEEDEPDLNRVDLGMDLFSAYSRGFLETAGPSLTRIEIDHLAFSAKFMTYLIGLRFLTDYLSNDVYYKIRFPGHNLQRASVQFTLLKSMEIHFAEMKDRIIEADQFSIPII